MRYLLDMDEIELLPGILAETGHFRFRLADEAPEDMTADRTTADMSTTAA